MKKRAEGLFAGLTLTAVLLVFGIGYLKSGIQQGEQTTYSEQAIPETQAENDLVRIEDTVPKSPAPEVTSLPAPATTSDATPVPEQTTIPVTTPEPTRMPAPTIPVTTSIPEVTPVPEQTTISVTTPEPTPMPVSEVTPAPAPQEEIAPEQVFTAPVLTTSDLLQCINAQRSLAGLAGFTWNDALASAASVRSVEIVSCFGHSRPDGTDFFTVSEQVMAENLARGYFDTTAEEIVAKWMESDTGHKQNILDGSLMSVGIHMYVYEDRIAVCVLFG